MNKATYFMLILFFICGTFAAAFSSVSTAELFTDSWSAKASMSYPRESLGVVAIGSKIYAIGGYRGYHDGYFDFLDINECYDPKTDTWTTLKPMPTPRSSFAIAAYEGKIYCIGGVIGTSNQGYGGTSANEVYDILTDSWSTKASAPFKLGWLSANAINGKIFVITANGELYMYDPFTDVWANKNNMPSPMVLPIASIVIDDTIIVIHTIRTLDYLEPGIKIYDTKTDMWHEGNTPDYLTPAISAAGATTGVYAPQRVYVLYKQYDTAVLSNCVYDPAKDTWSTAQSMSSDRGSFGVAVIDDLLYVIGGHTTTPWKYSSLNERYVPIGYKDAIPAPEPSNSPTSPVTTESISPTTSEPTDVSGPTVTYIIAAVLAVTIVTFTIVCFYISRKKKKVGFSL